MTPTPAVVIIGSGPVGFFAVFELGLLHFPAPLIDFLDSVGGLVPELYPEKPIYDIPAFPKITGQELTDKLISQIKPFVPIFHLNQQADSIKKIDDGWKIVTSEGTIINARCIVIAAGAGSFVPR
jgi:Thioredoxin reductase